MFCRELGVFVVVIAFAFFQIILVMQVGRERMRQRRFETGGVGSGLRAQLSEIEIRAGAVTDVHALVELTFGPEAVENHGVDGYGDGFNDDFDDGADQGPILRDVSIVPKCDLAIVLPEVCRSTRNGLRPGRVIAEYCHCKTIPTYLYRCRSLCYHAKRQRL